MSQTRLPAHIDARVVAPGETWVDKAITFHAAAAGDIAKCIADEAAYAVGEVLRKHHILSGDFLYGDDLDRLHNVITDIVARRLRERIIERLEALQKHPDLLSNVSRCELLIGLLRDFR